MAARIEAPQDMADARSLAGAPVVGQRFREKGRHFGQFSRGLFLSRISEGGACWPVGGFCFGGSNV